MENEMTQQLECGQVTVTLHKGGLWALVQIGRGKYTKRLNVSRAEASLLVRELKAEFGWD